MDFIEKIFKKSGWMSILESTIFIILGLILIMNPEGAITFISYVLGIIFIVVGICQIVNYFGAKGKYDFYNNDIIFGIMAIIIGIITIYYGSAIASILRIVVGIWIIYSSLVRFNASLKLKSVAENVWLYSACLAVIMFICGLITVLSTNAVVATIGVIMIIYSIIDIIESVIFMKNVKEIF